MFANAISRKRADQALRESEARLSLAAASAGAGLWILDIAGGHFWLTDKTRELLGVASDEELTFDRFINLIHPEDRERVAVPRSRPRSRAWSPGLNTVSSAPTGRFAGWSHSADLTAHRLGRRNP